MPLVTTTQIIDDSDGVTVIDPNGPHVELIDAASGQRLFFADWNAVGVFASAQQTLLTNTGAATGVVSG